MSEPFRTPYPGYDVLEKWDSPSYDAQTREVLTARRTPPPRRFFTEAEFAVLEALCARIVPQRRAEPVAIAPWLDAALYTGRGTGTRFAEMPEDGVAWRQAMAAFDAEAQARGATGFAALDPSAQDQLMRDVDGGALQAEAAWEGLPAQDFFRKLLMKQVVQFYYSQPAAMSEIGYGGPAAPRGYVRLGADRIDPWEAPFGQWPDKEETP